MELGSSMRGKKDGCAANHRQEEAVRSTWAVCESNQVSHVGNWERILTEGSCGLLIFGARVFLSFIIVKRSKTEVVICAFSEPVIWTDCAAAEAKKKVWFCLSNSSKLNRQIWTLSISRLHSHQICQCVISCSLPIYLNRNSRFRSKVGECLGFNLTQYQWHAALFNHIHAISGGLLCS